MNAIPKHALIYWDSDSPSPSVLGVLDAWETVCPDWSVTLHSRNSARDFIEAHYGADIAALFMSCRIPAMQSDVLRVLWALKLGGVYMDLTFQPRAEPLFGYPGCTLTVPRWAHGRIVNGVFAAQRNSPELMKVKTAILNNISQRRSDGVWGITGPGAWIEALGQEERPGFGIIPHQTLFHDYIRYSGYESSTRGTDAHWSVQQKNSPLYE